MSQSEIETRVYEKKNRHGEPSGVYWVHGFVEGKPWNASTRVRVPDFDGAVAAARELERARILASQSAPQDRKALARAELARDTTLEQGVAELIKWGLAEGNKPGTLRFYAERCASLQSTLGADFRLAQLADPDDGRALLQRYFTQRLQGATRKQRHTVQKDYRILRQLLGVAKSVGLWQGDLERLKLDLFTRKHKFYSPGETWLEEVEWIDALIEEVSSGQARVRRKGRNSQGREWVVRAKVRVNRKLHAISYVNLGLRDAELDTIYPHHVNLRNATVAINYPPTEAAPNEEQQRQGKTVSSKRVMPLNATMLEVMRRKLKGADPAKPLFEPWGGARRDIAAAWRRARRNLIRRRLDAGDVVGAKQLEMVLPRAITMNDLRRTFCSQMFKAGASIRECADLMGHEDEDMVRAVYRRVAPSHLAKVADLMPAVTLPAVPLTPQPAAAGASTNEHRAPQTRSRGRGA